MSIKARLTEQGGLYFCTFTCFNWLNLIEITDSYNSVYNFFNVLNEKQIYLYGYVIMPNHIHSIVKNSDGKLNTHVSNGKRFLAYDLIEKLNHFNRQDILKQLGDAVSESDKKAGKLHQVFKDSFDAKWLGNDEMIIQKLRYIHLNPVSKKWKLAYSYLNHVHSSARFYEFGEKAKVNIAHYRAE